MEVGNRLKLQARFTLRNCGCFYNSMGFAVPPHRSEQGNVQVFYDILGRPE